GGVIVDSGNFDWAAHSERFPGLTQPDGAYHGVVWTEAVGNLAYIIRARTVLLRNTGAATTPFNSWLFLQGLETLHLRMERHSENALKVAQWLEGRDEVSWVSYPGLESSPHKAIADRVFTGKGYSGLISFGIKTGREGGKKFIESLNLFSHLANIGDAKSLAIHNATTTHSQLKPEELEAAGVPEDMVRLSIGIENVVDIIADLEQALAAAS
ncbi:MAG TPA: PLP-dependent transferase, partial [Marmoricola sp.]|nr:PLP-dependent transferase [Marmoricola sp.]